MATYSPTLEEVRKLAAGGNTIPVFRELPADLETPVSVYLKLRNGGPSFLLESVEKGEQVGRYSFLGVRPPLTLCARGDRLVVGSGDGAALERRRGDPFDAVRSLLAERRPVEVPGLPRFSGGAVGYFGYDTVRFIERLPQTAQQKLEIPDMLLLFSDNLVVFDHVQHKLLVIANMHIGTNGAPAGQEISAAYEDAVARIDAIVSDLRQPFAHPKNPPVDCPVDWRSNFTQDEYEEIVRRAKEYIAAGDIFQVVPSQRLSRATDAEPFAIYRALRMLNPSPYMYFLEFNDMAGLSESTGSDQPLWIIGSSPEMHVRLEDGRAFLHPIAGTRWRGQTAAEDDALAEGLLNDPKERAEHVMLVDLGRNDLGRVCEYGTVQVPEMMVIERYSHVMHIVSDVQGQLAAGHDAISLLKATFPAGTVSGAPKVRAMEIIEELEGLRRGLYAGAVGYIDYDGTMDTCIAIRTIVMQGNTCHLQAGGGVVADSDPTYEWHETLNKAQALSAAVQRAEEGFGN
ncbi:MAG: anthranilate synthase component I [Caldilineaceae bacterium]|nr:anthranilate synthase component I [Caldilineaceae bacterium]